MPSFNPLVTWSDNEGLDASKLSEMTDNDNILYNSLPHYYSVLPSGTKDFNEGQTALLKPVIVAGVFNFHSMKGGHGQGHRIPFPKNAFAGGCNPVVLATPMGTSLQSRVTCVITTWNGAVGPLDTVGFTCHLYQRDGLKFDGNGLLHWMAFGYEAGTQ